MGILPGYKPVLDKFTRKKLNDLARLARHSIGTALQLYDDNRWGDRGQGSRLKALDLDDAIYTGHRFCEPGDKTFDNPDIWFFTIGATIRRRLSQLSSF